MIALTHEQEAAVRLVAEERPRIGCLTGGPGTGKSTTVRSILERLQREGVRVALCAPSGKAAKRLAETTGAPTQTIHRLLAIGPRDAEPRPIGAEVVIVDEASMVDVSLMALLLRSSFRAGGQARTVLLVGDRDQLPPVGPGQPFHDLLGGATVPTVRLTQVQRQAQESGIVRAAYAIQAGQVPEWREDCQLVHVPEPTSIPARVWQLVEEHGLDPDESQILAPQNKGACGVEALNRFIEQARWHNGPELVRDSFRRGTKVLHRKNDYEREIFNGEVGFCSAATAGKKRGEDRLEVEIAGRCGVEYRGPDVDLLQPAWALTVHKSQGSEFDAVILVCHGAHSRMLTRSLLYVAVTRARSRVFVVGTEEAVGLAVRTVRDVRRRTMLRRWLVQAAAARSAS